MTMLPKGFGVTRYYHAVRLINEWSVFDLKPAVFHGLLGITSSFAHFSEEVPRF